MAPWRIHTSHQKRKPLLSFRQVLTWKNNPPSRLLRVSGGAEREKTFGRRGRSRDFINVVRSAAPCSHGTLSYHRMESDVAIGPNNGTWSLSLNSKTLAIMEKVKVALYVSSSLIRKPLSLRGPLCIRKSCWAHK